MNNDGKMDAKEMPIFKRCMTRKEQGTPGYDADHDGQVSDRSSTRAPTSRSTMRRRGVDAGSRSSTSGEANHDASRHDEESIQTATSVAPAGWHSRRQLQHRRARRQRSWHGIELDDILGLDTLDNAPTCST